MNHYRIIVRDDEYEEAFICVGRFLSLLDNKNQRVKIVKKKAQEYVVTMPLSVVETVKNHGDVIEVIGMI